MCYFITIGVTKKFADQAFHLADQAHGATWQNNASIARALAPTFDAHFTLSKGPGCCCSLYSPSRHKAESLRKKYERKGWSEAKILRAIDAATKNDFLGFASQTRQLISDMTDKFGTLAVIVHWYKGTLDAEKIQCAQPPLRLNSATLRLGELMIDEDVLVQVCSAQGN